MVDDLVSLKQDINQLNRLIEAPKADVVSRAAKLARVEKGIHERDELIMQLQAENEQLRQSKEISDEKDRLHNQEHFGSSTQKTSRLLNDEEQAEQEAYAIDDELESEAKPKERKRGSKEQGKRVREMSALNPITELYEVPESERECPKCGSTMERIFDEHARYRIDRIPEKWVVRDLKRQVLECPCCRKNGTMSRKHAKVPPALFRGSPQSAEEIAYAVDQKFTYGVPLERTVKMLRRDGVPITSTDLTRGVNKSALLFLEPLVELMHKEALKEEILHVDESWFQVNREPERKPSTQSYMWQEQTGKYAVHPIILFFYYMTRKYANAKEILKGFIGYIICDGYQAYHELPSGIIPVGCWQHLREKFVKALKVMEPNQRKGSPADKGLNLVNQVFNNESDWDEQGLSPDKRCIERLKCSKPTTDELFEWATRMLEQPNIASSDNLLAKALRYAINQREYLENIYLDGRLEVSNNRAERIFAHFAICRRAFLFADTVDGAHADAIYFSIMLTAHANGLHARKYLQYLLEHLPGAKMSELRNYLPWSETLPDWLRLPKGQQTPNPASVA
ncbi:transposase [Clostridia bacterium]|nr:transposase [Clostridia bacterium]